MPALFRLATFIYFVKIFFLGRGEGKAPLAYPSFVRYSKSDYPCYYTCNPFLWPPSPQTQNPMKQDNKKLRRYKLQEERRSKEEK